MSCLTRNKALANQQKRTDLSKQNISGSNKITEIINAITIHWFDFFFFYIQNKIWVFFFDIMYISANKVNVTHSYTPQQRSTSPSTAGQEEALDHHHFEQNSKMKARASVQRKSGNACPVCRGWAEGGCKEKEDFSLSSTPSPLF